MTPLYFAGEPGRLRIKSRLAVPQRTDPVEKVAAIRALNVIPVFIDNSGGKGHDGTAERTGGVVLRVSA
jgi:hypothetical protein